MLPMADALGSALEIAVDADALLALPEAELLAQCRFAPYKSGGPGGQKRNKTTSAVRLIHEASGIIAHSSDFRSQTENRRRALHRLRFKIAAGVESRPTLDFRGYEPPPWIVEARVQGRLTTNVKNPLYARIAAHVLDVLEASGARPSMAAALLGIPVSNLIHVVEAEPTVNAAAARIRQRFGVVWRK